MKKKKGETEALRIEAERRLLARGAPSDIAPEDAVRLVHELEVHQIELEIQNEELSRSRTELELTLARYTALYDAAPVGFVTLSRDGTIRQANIPAAALIGGVPSDLAGRRLATFVADDRKSALDELLTRLNDGEDRVMGNVALVPPDSARAPRQVELMITRVAGSEERHAALVDVTERRLVEEQLRTAQKMEAIGRLAGGIAHDFNNLLTVILGHADLALETSPAPETCDEIVGLKGAANRAATLTRQLLAFGRKQTLKPQVLDVNELVDRLSKIIQRLLGERIQVRTSLTQDLARVEIDPGQLEQVVMNLAVNARDAMPSGGTLTFTTANAHDGGERVLLTVHDTGMGMDEATLSRIFEPFFTTKKYGEGTGFGLATVYGIVKQCGGEIAVRSKVDKGSTFEIRLPATRAALTTSAGHAPTAKATTTNVETILVVEDEPSLLPLVKRAIESAGYHVLTAASAEEALEVCARHEGRIHLALSDVILPHASGPAFAARLKETRPETKVIFMSGYARNELGADGVVDRGTHFISKPFTTDALTSLIRAVLDGTTPNTSEQ